MTVHLSALLSRVVAVVVTAIFVLCSAVQADYMSIPVNLPAGSYGRIPADPNYTFGWAEFTFTVPNVGNQTVIDVRLQLALAHSYLPELKLWLVSPAGTQIVLIPDGVGGSRRGYRDVLLADDTPTENFPLITQWNTVPQPSWPLVIVGTFNPYQAFSAFVGQNPAGTWTLRIYDYQSGSIGGLFAPGAVPGNLGWADWGSYVTEGTRLFLLVPEPFVSWLLLLSLPVIRPRRR